MQARMKNIVTIEGDQRDQGQPFQNAQIEDVAGKLKSKRTVLRFVADLCNETVDSQHHRHELCPIRQTRQQESGAAGENDNREG